MKKLTLLLMIIIPLTGKAQISGAWLAVESRQVTTDFISPIDGTIFDFSDDTLRIRNVNSDTTIQFQYRLADESIFVKDSLFASLKHLSSDSMKLQFEEWMLTLFHPLELNVANEQLTEDELINNSWVLKTAEGAQSIDFLNEPWEMFEHDISKICVTRRLGDWKGGGTEKWSLFEFNKSQLLTISFGQLDPIVYQIDSINGTTVRMSQINLWANSTSVTLVQSQNQPETEINKTKKLLVARKWKSKKLIDIQRPGPKDDSLWIDMKSSGFYAIDTVLITEDELINNKVSMRFRTDNTYTFYASNKSVTTGNWQLKNDGVTLVINSGVAPENYFNIISISENELIISSSDQFALEKGGRDYMKYYYTMKLK